MNFALKLLLLSKDYCTPGCLFLFVCFIYGLYARGLCYILLGLDIKKLVD